MRAVNLDLTAHHLPNVPIKTEVLHHFNRVCMIVEDTKVVWFMIIYGKEEEFV